MHQKSFIYAKRAFYTDGSLRDIYVLGTDEQDWQKLLDFLHTGSYSVKCIIAGEQSPFPERVADIFSLIHTDGGMLYIDAERLDLHCYCYAYEEIEFDVDPRNMNNEQQISRLLDFMRLVGTVLNKEIVLTPENMPNRPLFRFNPIIGEDEWDLDILFSE